MTDSVLRQPLQLSPGFDPAELQGDIEDARLAAALLRVTRHLFVPEHRRMVAYQDIEIPLGQGRRCPQPSAIVQLLNAANLDGPTVACVWAGSGYMVALLAAMDLDVHAVESPGALRDMAMCGLAALGLDHRVVWHDDIESLASESVQSAVVCAGVPRFPRRLLTKVPQHGRLVVPILRGHSAVVSVITRLTHGHRRQDRPSVALHTLDGIPTRR